MAVENNEIVLVKLVDGSFAIGKYLEMGADLKFVGDAYSLMLRQLQDGSIGVAIADFLAPFIQDGKGVTLTEKDWISTPQAIPESLRADYIQKKTGIVVAPSNIIKP